MPGLGVFILYYLIGFVLMWRMVFSYWHNWYVNNSYTATRDYRNRPMTLDVPDLILGATIATGVAIFAAFAGVPIWLGRTLYLKFDDRANGQLADKLAKKLAGAKDDEVR